MAVTRQGVLVSRRGTGTAVRRYLGPLQAGAGPSCGCCNHILVSHPNLVGLLSVLSLCLCVLYRTFTPSVNVTSLRGGIYLRYCYVKCLSAEIQVETSRSYEIAFQWMLGLMLAASVSAAQKMEDCPKPAGSTMSISPASTATLKNLAASRPLRRG